MNPRGFLAAVVVVLATTAAVSGCSASAGPIEPDFGARARLDVATGEVVHPLETFSYLALQSDADLMARAELVGVGSCMRAQGLQYSADQTAEILGVATDRPYGIWDVDRARTYGFSVPERPSSAIEAAEAEQFGSPWQTARSACAEALIDNPDFAAVRLTTEQTAGSLAQRLALEAYSAAQSDSGWEAARDDWRACITAHHLTAPSDGGWVSQEAAALSATDPAGDSEEAIRIATIEAQCNGEVQLTQRLGDLVAAYQSPLIDANEAALQDDAADIGQWRTAAEGYISEHG